MNNITSLQAEVICRSAEINMLRQGHVDLIAYLTSEKFAQDGRVNVQDVILRLRESEAAASEAASAAYVNEVGPSVATGGCPYVGRQTCSHEPSLRPNAYHCPLCAELLPGPWNDTDAKAAERMRSHWVTHHKVNA